MQGILKGCVILCTVYRDGAPVAPVPPSLENIVFSPSQLCQHRGAVWLNVRPFFQRESQLSAMILRLAVRPWRSVAVLCYHVAQGLASETDLAGVGCS